MYRYWASNNEPAAIYMTIKCQGKRTIRCYAEEFGKENSKYADRTIEVDGSRTIYFSLPVTPKKMAFAFVNIHSPHDESFTVEMDKKPLKTYNIWMDSDTVDFLSMAVPFAQMCGFEAASKKGRIFQSSDGKFTIKYFPVIVDYMSGRALNTPARIGHNTGIIENSKMRMDRYTVAQRMAINLHEFSHKYKNPKIGLDISNEIGADINALYIYLGLGFSKVDAIYVFANVFLKAQTDQNIERMRKIMEYIQKFENGEYAKVN